MYARRSYYDVDDPLQRRPADLGEQAGQHQRDRTRPVVLEQLSLEPLDRGTAQPVERGDRPALVEIRHARRRLHRHRAGVKRVCGGPERARITSYNVCYTKLLRGVIFFHFLLKGE